MNGEMRLPETGVAANVAAGINRLAVWIARHWLAIFNCVVGIFLGLPFLAPILMEAGAPGAARTLYAIYAPTCHQLPDRSFFLFGPQAVYSTTDLERDGVIPAGTTTLGRMALRATGTTTTGFKVAICQRDVAIYGSILIGGLVFGALRPVYQRRGRRFPKMRVGLYLLLLIPLFVDGATQIVGLRESTWWLRAITGGIFGAATVWLTYPYIDESMADVVRTSAPKTTTV